MITEELLLLHKYKLVRRGGRKWYGVDAATDTLLYYTPSVPYDSCPYCGSPRLNSAYASWPLDKSIPSSKECSVWMYKIFSCGVKAANAADILLATSGPTDMCKMVTTQENDDII